MLPKVCRLNFPKELDMMSLYFEFVFDILIPPQNTKGEVAILKVFKMTIKLSVKSGKDGTWTRSMVWIHKVSSTGWDFKNRKKKVHQTSSTGYETQFSSKFGANLSLPCPFFSWTPSTNQCCCYVYCSYKCSQWCI